MEREILDLMTQLARENWNSTGMALASLLEETGEYEEARNVMRQVSNPKAFVYPRLRGEGAVLFEIETSEY